MSQKNAKALIQQLFAVADISTHSQNPWDIHVKNENFYAQVLKNPVLGLGETYADGWWDCPNLDQFFYKLLRSDLESKVYSDRQFLVFILHVKLKLFLSNLTNLQSKARAYEVGKRHYDIGNQLYQKMLDKRMNYSCGYWKDATTLDEAQEAKLELICRKLQLQSGMRVLDIGCGWGGFSKYAAEKYGVSVLGITVSKRQQEYAQQSCANLPVEIRLQDYRDLNEKFDCISSVGMFEHVGPKNYIEYMQVAHRCLKDDGLFLLHTIGGNFSMKYPNEWIHKYIFPNGILPSIQQVGKSIEKRFVMEDWHNFGEHYDKTLMAWHHNFNQHWDDLRKDYDDRFYRIWNYYLSACAGAFRARDIQLWQIVLSKKGLVGGYSSIR